MIHSNISLKRLLLGRKFLVCAALLVAQRTSNFDLNVVRVTTHLKYVLQSAIGHQLRSIGDRTNNYEFGMPVKVTNV